MIEGIDVSYWQGAIDWSPVAGESKRFVVVRGGDGRFGDPRRVEYARAANQAGLIVNTYHFLRWQIPVAEMADICRESYNDVQDSTRQKGRLWLDAEDTNAGPKSLGWLKDVIAELGGIPLGIYTGAWWWNSAMPASHGLDDLPLWFAHYPRNNTVHSDPTESGIAPTLPNGWDGWAIWQYSSTGAVAGIGPSVDLNVAQDGVFDDQEEEQDMPTLVQRVDGEERGAYYIVGANGRKRGIKNTDELRALVKAGVIPSTRATELTFDEIKDIPSELTPLVTVVSPETSTMTATELADAVMDELRNRLAL